MVPKTQQEQHSTVKVSKLQLHKETIKDLSDSEARQVMGGACHSNGCGTTFSKRLQQTCASYGPAQCGGQSAAGN